MRAYILTKRERKILEAYVEKNIRLDGFSVLSLRLKRANSTILADAELVEKTLEKLNKENETASKLFKHEK
jgi:hypothetical protein